MPRSLELHKYDAMLVEFAQQPFTQPAVLQFPTLKQANGMRLTFYGLKGAIRAERAEQLFFAFMRTSMITRENPDGTATLTIASPEHAEIIPPAAQQSILAFIQAQTQTQPKPQEGLTNTPAPEESIAPVEDMYSKYLKGTTND